MFLCSTTWFILKQLCKIKIKMHKSQLYLKTEIAITELNCANSESQNSKILYIPNKHELHHEYKK